MVGKLLSKDPKKRIGATGGVNEVLQHPWFANINVEDFEQRRIQPEFMPKPFSLNIFAPFHRMKSGVNILEERELATDKM